MSNRRFSVNIIKEIKRLNEAGSNNTEIEKALGISRKTVRGYLASAQAFPKQSRN
jgi:transposase